MKMDQTDKAQAGPHPRASPQAGPLPQSPSPSRASRTAPKQTEEFLSQQETEMVALLPGTQSSSLLKSSERNLEDIEMGGGEARHDHVIRDHDRKRAWTWIVGISVIILVGFVMLYIVFSRVKVLQTAGKKALRSGIPGALAMAVQVLILMWSRTIVNYQYRHGVSMTQATKTLWAQGGIPRLYRGLVFALIQGPLARFGDTASNDGVQALLNAHASTAGLPLGIKSLFCSLAAGLWRIFIMPVDTIKTKMQVEGKEAVSSLINRIVRHGPSCLYEGWLANQAAGMMGHYPWFATRNYMLVLFSDVAPALVPLRDGFIGLCASIVSDIVSNCARVLKTYKQTSARDLTYREAIASITRADGLAGLFLRGLKMKLLSNALQSIVFNITWEYFKQMLGEGGLK